MIGVVADPVDQDVAREFFELFKTPWEFYRSDRHYDVLLCTGDGQIDGTAKLVLLYSGRKTPSNNGQKFQSGHRVNTTPLLSYRGNRFPIYGDLVKFPEKADAFLVVEELQEHVAYIERSNDRTLVRIGYDLFSEVRKLLTAGQPCARANVPTLEVHIALLRDLITGCGIQLAEIPPVPQGFQFVACLTHDVDHPSLRQHKLDHTIAGFLFRAIIVSIVDTLLGRMSIRHAWKSWVAAVKLPFVFLGLAKDFWRDFDDRYLELEKDLPSTFFVIPRKNYAGKLVNGPAPALRATCYEAKEIVDKIGRLRSTGHEVGLHGIDAWLDSAAGRGEFEEVRRLTGVSELGVRMHWLYYNEKSPATLEKAGAAYDSTIGYNETVGYRAGTTQVYKPLDVERLLEIPMHAMDTALFYLSYLGLSPQQAGSRLHQLTDNVARFGGCFTVNWHDRSLAPERLWGGCYRELVQEMKTRGAWFATASQTTAWFRKRRSATFETDDPEVGKVRAKVAVASGDNLPGLRFRIHEVRETGLAGSHHSGNYLDKMVDEGVVVDIVSEAQK